jgi:hypothetical protein
MMLPYDSTFNPPAPVLEIVHFILTLSGKDLTLELRDP